MTFAEQRVSDPLALFFISMIQRQPSRSPRWPLGLILLNVCVGQGAVLGETQEVSAPVFSCFRRFRAIRWRGEIVDGYELVSPHRHGCVLRLGGMRP